MVAILRNVNLVVVGRGYAGEIDEVIPPVPTIKTETIRPGGTDLDIERDQGMEALVATLSLYGIAPGILDLLGVHDDTNQEMVMRGAYQDDDGSVMAAVATMRGWFKMQDLGTWKAGTTPPMKATMTCNFYELMLDGTEKYFIDGPNNIRRINGVDQLEAIRTALNI